MSEPIDDTVDISGGDFQPLGDRILVRREGLPSMTPGGIIIPETAREKPFRGEVLATGPGARDQDGRRIPIELQAGDIVLFGRWAGVEVRLGEVELLILKEGDVLGRVRPRSA